MAQPIPYQTYALNGSTPMEASKNYIVNMNAQQSNLNKTYSGGNITVPSFNTGAPDISPINSNSTSQLGNTINTQSTANSEYDSYASVGGKKRKTIKRKKLLRHKNLTKNIKKRISKMKCQSSSRKNSKLPPFKANTCPNKIKKGKDGMYISCHNINGIWFWKKKVKNK